MSRVFKTKKKLNGSKVYKAWKEWQAGDYVIGKYSGTSKDKYRKNSWHLDIIETSFADGSTFDEGKTMGINSTGMVDKVMEGVDLGEIIRMDYEGTEVLTSGDFEGSDAHVTTVSILEEDDGSGVEQEEDDGL